jgi:hypothetical protein
MAAVSIVPLIAPTAESTIARRIRCAKAHKRVATLGRVSLKPGPRWTVPLPRGAEPPYRVFVNGVPQTEGVDYEVRGHALSFDRHLEKEGRLGTVRWTAIFLGLFGTYRKNDSVDVQYTIHGQERSATYLDIVPPAEQGN